MSTYVVKGGRIALGLVLAWLTLPGVLYGQQADTLESGRTRYPAGWLEWKPYEAPAAEDSAGWEWTPEAARRQGTFPPTRWLSVDPLADDYPGWSPYNYALDNPVLYTDPTGLFPTCGDANNCDEYYKSGSVASNQWGEWTYSGNNQWQVAGSGITVGIEDLQASFDAVLEPGSGGGALAEASAGALAFARSGGTAIPYANAAIAGTLALAAAYDATQRTFVTYALTNPATGQVYAGRASGFGTPHQVMMGRFAGHHMRVQGFGSPTLDATAQGELYRPANRGREQQLIDFYGGVGHSGVANQRRGVAAANPFGPFFHRESNRVWGPLAPYTGR